MVILESLRIALQSLRANPLRSLRTLVGIAVGIGAVLHVVALGRATQANITDRLESMGTNVLLIRPGYSHLRGVRTAEGVTSLTWEDARELAATAGAVRARPRIQDPVRSEVDALNTSAAAVAARGRAALDAARFEDALELLLLSDEWKPESANVQYNLGVCYLRLGQRERARARFEDAVSIANDAEALWRLGMLSLEDGDHDLALDRLRLANDRAHEGGALFARIATGIARAGRPQEALPIFERATELGPDGAGVRGNWGAALLELGRADEALVQFRRAIGLEPDHPRAYVNAGGAMEALGNTEAAARYYREALARDPRGPARERLDRLERP